MLFYELKELNDADRDLPLRWRVIHMYSSTQIAKMIAIKRGLDPELAGLIAAMHDIAVVKTKRTENHAQEAGKYIIELIDTYNTKGRKNLPEIKVEEKELIIEAVFQHSDKKTDSGKICMKVFKELDLKNGV